MPLSLYKPGYIPAVGAQSRIFTRAAGSLGAPGAAVADLVHAAADHVASLTVVAHVQPIHVRNGEDST